MNLVKFGELLIGARPPSSPDSLASNGFLVAAFKFARSGGTGTHPSNVACMPKYAQIQRSDIGMIDAPADYSRALMSRGSRGRYDSTSNARLN